IDRWADAGPHGAVAVIIERSVTGNQLLHIKSSLRQGIDPRCRIQSRGRMAFFSQWLDMRRDEGISCSIDHFIAPRRKYFEMWADFAISRIDLSERVQWREVAIGIDSNHFRPPSVAT